MTEAIRYCDACGKIVLPSDVQSGAAFVSPSGTMCPACLANLPPGQRARLARRTPPRRRTPRPERRSVTPRDGSRRVGTGRATPVPRGNAATVLMIAGAAAGVLLGVAIVLLLVGGDDRQPAAAALPAPPVTPAPSVAVPMAVTDPSPAPPAPPSTVAPLEPTIPAGSAEASARLAGIREMVTPDYRRYADIVDGLTSLIARYPDPQATEEARTLLAETRAGAAALARAELQKTRASAHTLTASGRYSTAISLLRSLRPRFGDTEWYETEGDAAVDSAIAEVESERDRVQREAAEAVAGGTPLFNVSFDRDAQDGAPATAPAEPEGVSILPTSLTTDGEERVTVRAPGGGFDSNAIQITDTNTGKPNVTFAPTRPVTRGLVVVMWRSAVTGYTSTGKLETAFTFRCKGTHGNPFFGVTYVKNKHADKGGVINVDFCPRPQRWAEDSRRHRNWSVGGTPDEFVLVFDLDNAHATMKRNGRVLIDRTPLDRKRYDGGFRGLAILDGWAAGSRGGGFVAVVDDVRIVVQERAP